MRNKGFIALISVLIISVLLLIAVVSLAQYGVISRFALLALEQKNISYQHALGCVQVAVLAVSNDPLYEVANMLVPLDHGTCIINNIYASTPSAGYSRIETSASSLGATTNLSVEVDVNSGSVTHFQELPTL